MFLLKMLFGMIPNIIGKFADARKNKRELANAIAVKTLEGVLKSGNLHEALAAQNALDFMRESGRVTLARAQDLLRGLKFGEPADRIPRYLLEMPLTPGERRPCGHPEERV